MAWAVHRGSLQLALVGLLGGVLPGAAYAKRIAILGIGGQRGGEATQVVARAVAGKHEVVSRGRVQQEARRLNANLSTPIGRSTVARSLKIAALIGGSLGRVRMDWVLNVLVYSGHSGQPAAAVVVPLRGTRIDPNAIRRVTVGVNQGIARARPGPPLAHGATVVAVRSRPPAVRPTPPPRRPIAVRRPTPVRPAPVRPAPVRPAPVRPAPPPRRTARADDFDDGSDVNGGKPDDTADDPKPVRRPVVAKRGSDGDGSGDSGELGFEVNDGDRSAETSEPKRDKEPDATAKTTKKDTRPFWERTIELSVGMMLLSRSFDFNDPVQPKSPSNYRSPPVAAILAEAAFYPVAWFGRGPLANLGIVGSYYRVLVLQSQLQGYGQPVGTTLHQFEVGLRYRWNILNRAISPTLKVGLNFGRLGFSIHWEEGMTTTTVTLPDIAYLYLKLALLGLDVPFYSTRRFGIGASVTFDYLYVFSAGPIEATDSGGYGKSSTGGIDFSGGVYATFGGWFIRVSGFYRRFFFAFDNDCYQKKTGCNAAGGALDIYRGMWVLGGYAFSL
jgi:hypothetical protein